MRPRYIIFTLVFGLLLSAYFKNVFTDNRLFTERDLSVFFYPYIHLWLECIKSGELPLWNPYIMCGEPLLASVQPAFLYPPSIIYLLLPSDIAFNLNIIIHFFLTGLFTFMLMKEVGSSDGAAAIAAVAFVFGGYLLSVHNLLSTLLSVAWAPIVVICYLRAIRLNALKYSFIGAGLLYCMFTAGGMEILLMTAGILCLLAAFPLFYSNNHIEMPLAKRVGLLAATFSMFCGLAAIQLLPFLELTRLSIRSNGIAYEEAILWSLEPRNLIYLFIPDAFWKGHEYYWKNQSWLKTVYTGLLPFLLASFFLLERGGRRLLAVSTASVALVLALGRYTPLYKYLFEWIPVFDVVRYPVKFFFIFIFFTCLAAGWGWDYFMTHISQRNVKRLAFCLFVIFGFCGSLAFLAIGLNPEGVWDTFRGDSLFAESKLSPGAILHNIQRVIVFGILYATWLYVIVRKQWARPLGFYGLMGLLVVDLFLGNYGFYLAARRDVYHGATPNAEVLMQDDTLYRVYAQKKIMDMEFTYKGHDGYIQTIQNVFATNSLIERKRFDVNGFSVLALKDYFNVLSLLWTAPLPDSTNLLNLLNVKYVLWSEELACPGYELVRKDKLYLYKNSNCLPRAFLAKSYRVLNNVEEFRTILQSREFNPQETVLLKQQPDITAYTMHEEPQMQDRIEIAAYTHNTVKVQAESSRTQFLVMSEAYFPGWRAYLDGKEVPIYEANFAFRAVIVPAGSHEVRFAYRPFSFTLGAGISIISLAAGLFLMLIFRKQNPMAKEQA